MAITQAMCTLFKKDLLLGDHHLDSDTLYIALYTNSATLNATTSVYITADEVTGNVASNYTTGGNALTNVAISVDGTTAIFDADNVTFPNATISAQAALLYNANNSNSAIAVLDFGGVKTSTNGTFELQFPTANSTAGLIRIA